MKLDIEKEKLATEISKIFPEWRGRNFSIWREGKEQSFFVYFGKRSVRSKGVKLNAQQLRLLERYTEICVSLDEAGQ